MPSYAIDGFRSHFRLTKTTFEVLAQELASTGAISTGNRFGRKPNQLQRQILAFNLHLAPYKLACTRSAAATLTHPM